MDLGLYNDAVNEASQTQPIFGRENDMKRNNAGGFVFTVDCWSMLKRFLILGTEGGTYYVDQRRHTISNAKNVAACIKKDPDKVLEIITDVSVSGKAPKNTHALFVLAMLVSPVYNGNTASRKRAFEALPKLARIGTHLFEFLELCKTTKRGGGKLYKKYVSQWYQDKEIDKLAYQVIKYRQRSNWTHRDVLQIGRAHV